MEKPGRLLLFYSTPAVVTEKSSVVPYLFLSSWLYPLRGAVGLVGVTVWSGFCMGLLFEAPPWREPDETNHSASSCWPYFLPGLYLDLFYGGLFVTVDTDGNVQASLCHHKTSHLPYPVAAAAAAAVPPPSPCTTGLMLKCCCNPVTF